MQNGQFKSKTKNAKNMRKTILPEHKNCSVQKNTQKNVKFWRNETILKIGHLANGMVIAFANGMAIAFAKWSVFVKS